QVSQLLPVSADSCLSRTVVRAVAEGSRVGPDLPRVRPGTFWRTVATVPGCSGRAACSGRYGNVLISRSPWWRPSLFPQPLEGRFVMPEETDIVEQQDTGSEEVVEETTTDDGGAEQK